MSLALLHRLKNAQLREQLLDDCAYVEYRDKLGGWKTCQPEDIKEPAGNAVVSHIVRRLVNSTVVDPDPAPEPDFPPARLRAAVIGKAFSGFEAAIDIFAQENDVQVLVPDTLISEAVLVNVVELTCH